MAISQECLQSILRELPEGQRQSAMRRILHADAAGWVGISVWTWFSSRRHQADLVAITPRGEFRFLPWEGTPGER